MGPSPDRVCKEYAGKKIRITVRPLESEENVVLIESGREGLEFLGKLFLAQAQAEDCGFQLGRSGTGKAFFSKHSSTGIYIHCAHRSPARKSKRANAKPGHSLKKVPGE